MSSVAATDGALLIGRNIEVRLQQVGIEQQPLMIVDHMLDDPHAMIEAARTTQFYVPEHTNYPGINARLPDAYYRTVIATLRGPLEAAFGLSRSAHLKYFGFFALATTRSDAARPIQKIPHHDSPDPGRLAMVHYLCQGAFGGTGFFRHKATGFESVDATRRDAYVAAASRELAQSSDTAAYAGPVMANYEMIGRAEMIFNRLIVYRSHVLHSALLDDVAGSADPAKGRLTANGFLEATTGP
ncbi:hypothetical protein HNQ60_004864 [Povalibacter uvarum]|uniref:Uncharacterized protein n=1 Tax=Povalibacter uvarum TaxID=732238 RepID=A0A841HT69_9GAMM|nr:DUF6445 family protein [Povalibacter uvarum]MBB6095973.1 hypothetical protein [Povalibacter uvarum]